MGVQLSRALREDEVAELVADTGYSTAAVGEQCRKSASLRSVLGPVKGDTDSRCGLWDFDSSVNKVEVPELLLQRKLFMKISARQITRLYCRFSNLDKANKGYLSREDFEHIPELAINPLGDRIIEAFVEGGQDDRVNFKQFVSVLARFRPVKKGASRQSSLNTTEEKLRFAFNMYDMDRDGKISAQELTEVLKMMVGSNVSPEQLQSIASCTMQEVDMDQDGSISFSDFQQAMKGIEIDEKMSIRFLS